MLASGGLSGMAPFRLPLHGQRAAIYQALLAARCCAVPKRLVTNGPRLSPSSWRLLYLPDREPAMQARVKRSMPRCLGAKCMVIARGVCN